MTNQLKTAITPNSSQFARQLKLMNWVNGFYGAIGIALYAAYGGVESWKSFAVGWVLSVVNLELLKRIGVFVFAIYEGKTLDPRFYAFAVGKFAFWGVVIALFSSASWIEALPFALGALTLVVAGLGLAIGFSSRFGQYERA